MSIGRVISEDVYYATRALLNYSMVPIDVHWHSLTPEEKRIIGNEEMFNKIIFEFNLPL
ncbi:MAG: hypothetical protein ACXABY_21225 [Candidatus Thorarchaeota archaeon]|jgi:hypothetical protein